MIYMHRGYHNEYIPENSMVSFIKAKEKNLGIELDVWMIKSGELIVFHDSNLKRMSGLNKLVEDTTYDEIKKLKLLIKIIFHLCLVRILFIRDVLRRFCCWMKFFWKILLMMIVR